MAEERKDTALPSEILIPHRPSPRFIRDFASGVIVSGPSPDGTYHLVFHADTINIVAETAVRLQDDAYRTQVKDDQIQRFREDKVLLTVPGYALQDLYNLLHEKFGFNKTANNPAAKKE